jgi:septum site-determining protein MinD
VSFYRSKEVKTERQREQMKNGRILVVTNRKGGTGKSSVCASLALTLAKSGHKTLLIDCDFGMRNQDLFFGVTAEAMFDIADAAVGRVAPERCVVCVPQVEHLFLCPAPNQYTEGTVTKEAMKVAVDAMAQAVDAEFVLLDAPGAQCEACDLAMSVSDGALVVSSLQPTSLRAATQTNLALQQAGVRDCHLILNGLDLSYPNRSYRQAFLDAIDETAMPLIGVVPYDAQIGALQAKEDVASGDWQKDTKTAFSNIARRLLKENVPLFSHFTKVDRARVLH